MYKSSFRGTVVSQFKGDGSSRIIEFKKGDYVRNSSGFIRNDFSVLTDTQDKLSMARVLEQMQEIASNEPDNSEKTFDEIVAEVRPRWCQSPAELDRFELYCIDNALALYSKLKKLDDEQKEALAHAKEEERKRIIAELKADGSPSPSADDGSPSVES